MRARLVATPILAAFALLLPSADAAPSTAFVVPDPTGDANFSGLHEQRLPGSQAAFDIASVTFDTTKTTTYVVKKKKKVPVVTPTGISITLGMASAPSTVPGSSYGVTGTHSVCENLRLQIYYTEAGPTTYGDLSQCGTGGTATSDTQYSIEFTPRIDGNNLVLQIPFKALPKQFAVGTMVDEITAYTSTAEFVVAGYQPTDFVAAAGIDTVAAPAPWKIK